MKGFILFFLLFNIAYLQARTTLEQIKINKPFISAQYAFELAKSINKAADKYKVPANVLTAIAMLESSYVLNAVNISSNDYGLFQINMFNIKAYEFNIPLLLTDLDYSVDSGAIVFQWFYKRYKLDDAIKRYNCGTRNSCVDWEVAKKYLRLVSKYM
jgi:soluble lytic murein transglycosylase-like protein